MQNMLVYEKEQSDFIKTYHTRGIRSFVQYLRDDVRIRAIRSAGISFPICETLLKNKTSKTN